MTIKEALNQYSTNDIQTTLGDNIVTVCWRLYGSLSEHNQAVLMALNIRYDWDRIAPASLIRYFPEYVNNLIEI